MNEELYQTQKPSSIKHLFASIAPRYNLGNSVLSMQLHKRWNKRLVEETVGVCHPREYLDLCCGTGDIAQAALQRASPPANIYLIDFCPEMLAEAKKSVKKPCSFFVDLNFIVGDAQNIPLPDRSVDCITVAYGIRNVADPYLCLQEMLRVLRPKGIAGILELTRPTHPLLQLGHTLYLKSIVPVVGRLLTANRKAYEYLQRSVRHFVSPHALKIMMGAAGFHKVRVYSLSAGIATLFVGKKLTKAQAVETGFQEHHVKSRSEQG